MNMKAGIRVTFLRAKEHQRWPANPRKPGEKLGQILLTVLEGSCPADTVGHRGLSGERDDGPRGLCEEGKGSSAHAPR